MMFFEGMRDWVWELTMLTIKEKVRGPLTILTINLKIILR